MKKTQVISHCPVCNEDMIITSLHCSKCNIEINGQFGLSRLNMLSKEQIEFVEIFLKNHGNIKAIEKELNISYPTVKRNLNDILQRMGYDVVNSENKDIMSRNEILEKLANKEISFEKANELLKQRGE